MVPAAGILLTVDEASAAMENSAHKLARDLLRLGELNEASRIAEDEIRRVDDCGNTTEIWQHRFIRTEIMRSCGRTEEALKYLESQGSLNPPEGSDTESCARLEMHRGYCYGLLGRYGARVRCSLRPRLGRGMPVYLSFCARCTNVKR
jgi:hypothetical protein